MKQSELDLKKLINKFLTNVFTFLNDLHVLTTNATLNILYYININCFFHSKKTANLTY